MLEKMYKMRYSRY